VSLDAQQLLDTLQDYRDCPAWWVGLSGGLDSTVLLHLLASLPGSPRLRAVHVNHQLNPDSDRWEQHCRSQCDDLGVELLTERVLVEPAGSGPEAAARQARYAVFEACLAPGEPLLLAHHLDDQVETFFLRLLRGAGTRGLSGMPARRSLGQGVLLRPLLAYPRAELESWARAQGLAWCEDPSNRDESLDRNYLRRQVLPLLEERWPAYRRLVAGAADSIRVADERLREQDMLRLGDATGSCFGEPTLDLAAAEDGQALARLLRSWLLEAALPLPGREALREFVGQCSAGSEGSGAALSGHGYELRRHGGHLHLAAKLQPPPAGSTPVSDAALRLAGVGTLRWRRESGVGLRELPDRLRFRGGGERCRPVGRAHGQSLKKLLQEYRVPRWWRDRVPLFYRGDELVAVGDLWVCEGFQAGPGEPGWAVSWCRELVLATPD
jgi:tRNA(Ile)-lysidine synthase